MSMSASRCPSDASLRAVAAPMPVVEPVTTIRSDASVIPSSFVLRRRCRWRLELPPLEGRTETLLTRSEANAIWAAESYIEIMSFSRQGLIEQLEYEGFSTSEATLAVDSLEVDWNEQAVESASSYLEVMSFSREGLIEQLEFDGFTTEEATVGVDSVSVDWNEQAWRSAEAYLEIMPFSRSELIDQLKFDGFTTEQATYAVDRAGL